MDVKSSCAGHRRHVHSGTVCACAASGPGRGEEPVDGSTGVWAGAKDGVEDARVRDAAGLSAAEAGTAAQAGAVTGRDRRHFERGQDAASQAASHGQADFRTAQGRVPVLQRLHHRQGLRSRRTTAQAGDVRSAGASGGRSAGGLRRALVAIGGVERKAHYLAMDLPHSDNCFVERFRSRRQKLFSHPSKQRPLAGDHGWKAMRGPWRTSGVCPSAFSTTTARSRWRRYWAARSGRRREPSWIGILASERSI